MLALRADFLALRDPASVLLLAVTRARLPPKHTASPFTCRRPSPRSDPQTGEGGITRKIRASPTLPVGCMGNYQM